MDGCEQRTLAIENPVFGMLLRSKIFFCRREEFVQSVGWMDGCDS